MAPSRMSPAQSVDRRLHVWDPLVRLLHWTLVVAFVVAYLTGDDLLTVHSWAGYVAGTVVAVRVLWGFIGPRRARFADFVYSPATVLRYSLDLVSLRGTRRYLGHSPAGGLMVVVVLMVMAATVGSGLVVLALEEGTGPLAGYVAATPESRARRPADGEDAREEEREHRRERGGDWGELHEFLSNLLLTLVILHIAGVLLASYVHRENLILAMFTGAKRANGE